MKARTAAAVALLTFAPRLSWPQEKARGFAFLAGPEA